MAFDEDIEALDDTDAFPAMGEAVKPVDGAEAEEDWSMEQPKEEELETPELEFPTETFGITPTGVVVDNSNQGAPNEKTIDINIGDGDATPKSTRRRRRRVDLDTEEEEPEEEVVEEKEDKDKSSDGDMDWSWLNEEFLQTIKDGKAAEVLAEKYDWWDPDHQEETKPLSRYALREEHFEGFIATRRLCIVVIYNDDNDKEYDDMWHAISMAYQILSGQVRAPMAHGTRLNVSLDWADISAEDYPNIVNLIGKPDIDIPVLLVYRRGRLIKEITLDVPGAMANTIKKTIVDAVNESYWEQMPKNPSDIAAELNCVFNMLDETTEMVIRVFVGGFLGMIITLFGSWFLGAVLGEETQRRLNQAIDSYLPKFMRSAESESASGGPTDSDADYTKAYVVSGADDHDSGEIRRRGWEIKQER